MVENITVEDVDRALEGDFEPRDQQIMDSAPMVERPDQDFGLLRPVGTGKTEIAYMSMLGKAVQRSQQGEDYRGMVILPSNSLVRQWDERATRWNIDELLDVKVNQTKDEFINWERIKKLPGDGNGRKQQMIEVGERDFKRHREKVYGSDSTAFSDTEELWKGHRIEGQEGADVILTTHHLLKSDIENGRIDLDKLDIDDIFIDEATSFVARNKEANEDETFYGGYRVARNFEEIVDEMHDETRFVGLTALPGRKLEPIIDYMGAELINPPHENLETSMADASSTYHQVEENLMAKDVFSEDDDEIGYTEKIVNRIVSDLEGKDGLRDKFRYAVANNTDASFSQDMNVYGYVGHENEEIQNAAIAVLKKKNELQRIFEGGIHTTGIDTPPGYTDPKVERVQELTEDFEAEGENYVLFTSHKKTAEYLAEVVGEGTEVVTGDYTDDSNEEILESFGDEVNSIVMSYDYGAEGIDLPEGDYVVHMTDRINPELKKSATGRIKRGSDIEEHTLTYEFEGQSKREANEYASDIIQPSSQRTRSTLRRMLGQTEREIQDMLQQRTMRGATEKYGHLMNTPTLSDR